MFNTKNVYFSLRMVIRPHASESPGMFVLNASRKRQADRHIDTGLCETPQVLTDRVERV